MKTKSLLYTLLQAAVVGTAASVLICLYKFLIKYIIAFAKSGYAFMRGHLWAVLPISAVMLGAALLFARIYRKVPELKGGGIPISICAIRNLSAFDGIKNLIGVFCLSLCSFLFGLPLGNEGPSVQMGTAMGDIVSRIFGKKERVTDMTGGACAGFTVATGAPISGILFAVEEAHKKVSGKIIATAAVSVLFAALTSELLSPVLGVSKGLFEAVTLPTLSAKELWLPLACGVVLGLFSVLFLHYYRLLDTLSNKKAGAVPHFIKLFVIFVLTLGVGLYSFDMISTGHDLVHHLGEGNMALYLTVLILLVRTTLTLGANANGVTGGIFLPLLALGATAAAILANLCVSLGMSGSYYLLIVMLGIVGCVAGMMKMPLTAVVFAVEALSLHANLLSVIITATVTFVITELFRVESITEIIVERKEKAKEKEQRSVSVG